MYKRILVNIGLIVLFGLLMVYLIHLSEFFAHKERKLLPSGVIEVYEKSFSNHTYIMKALLSEDQFKDYIRKLGMIKADEIVLEELNFQWIFTTGDGKIPAWWNPTAGSPNVYYDPKCHMPSEFRVLKYENEYIYLRYGSF